MRLVRCSSDFIGREYIMPLSFTTEKFHGNIAARVSRIDLLSGGGSSTKSMRRSFLCRARQEFLSQATKRSLSDESKMYRRVRRRRRDTRSLHQFPPFVTGRFPRPLESRSAELIVKIVFLCRWKLHYGAKTPSRKTRRKDTLLLRRNLPFALKCHSCVCEICRNIYTTSYRFD